VRDVLRTDDAATIRRIALRAEPELAEIFHFAVSVGATFGIRRRDGSRVAVKVNKLFTDESYFADIQQLQTALADVGFPAPRPVRRLGATTVDEWLDAGDFRDAHDPAVRRAMAETLARFLALATATGLRPRRTFLRPEGALWPKPHNALFDFEATSAGAGWIDAIGGAALARSADSGLPEVVGHTDWAAKHLRFDHDLQPTALYDWDSVTTGSEAMFAGSAAASFTYTEELGDHVERWPTAEEALAFVADYEEARGSAFSDEERAAVHASCVYLRAYAARCGHALGADVSSLLPFAEALR
jgi:hypothetical protein